MNNIRFAIVGFGHIGHKHLEHIIAHPNADIVGISDIDSSTFSTIKIENIPTFSSLKKMLSSCAIDVLCVCTPNYLHCEHTILGLENNCHVVVEKPMALTVSDCERMIATSLAVKKTIYTVMQNRYAPSAQWLKKLIKENVLGRVFQIQVNCIWNRNRQYYEQSSWRGTSDKDGGILFTQFSHFVDILYYLHGDVQVYIAGFIANYNHPYIEMEDTGTFLMRSTNGAIIDFNYSICSFEKNMESSLTIIAENGTIKIGGQYLNKIEFCNIQDETIQVPSMDNSLPNDYGFYQGSMNNHDKLIANVIDNLYYHKPMLSTAEDGKAVINIINNMYNTAKKNRAF